MHLILIVSTLITSVPHSGAEPFLSTQAASSRVRLLDTEDAQPRLPGSLLAQADTPAGEHREQSEQATVAAMKRADLATTLKGLKLERSQMMSGVWAAGLMGGGVVTFLLTSMLVGGVMVAIGAIVGIYYLAASSDLDLRIRHTEDELRNIVPDTSPRVSMVATPRLTVARF